MKKILADIHNAVQNSRDAAAFLVENSKKIWLHDTPIALLHNRARMDASLDEAAFEALSFFDTDGFSKESYTAQEIANLKERVPNAMKYAYLLCVKSNPTAFHFRAKHEGDRYKKIQDDGNFEAFVATAKFGEEVDSKAIETALRDTMRSAKEIPALKATAFIWIASIPRSTYVTDILEHYFGNKHIYVQRGRKISYIAWSETLSEINMRHFVNTP